MEPGEFRGKIGTSFADSTPYWPPTPKPPENAPNVVLVVLDDVGFAQLGCFGSDIDTPVIDGLARRGLRYTNFHTTALCSPTRACLLTGRNHHANGMGRVTELATGFPGYDSRIPRGNGFLSEILVEAGYATFAVGKWHLTPEDDCHLAASRQHWPLSRGFERFYGFLEGETHQFVPALVSDSHQILPPATPEEGYHLTVDLVDQAIGMVDDLRAIDPDKPFFMYLCPGACHAPHQSPPEWLAKYKGAFDEGWDEWRLQTLERQKAEGVMPEGTTLSDRPDWVPAWTDLSNDEKRLYARYMEAFAAFLSHTDDQLGRVLDALERTGDLENTIVLVLSDNGASSEGGPTGSVNDIRPWNMAPRTVEEAIERIDEIGGPFCHNNYPWGWTVAGNTPFRRWKREVHEGGVADPFIVSWPKGLKEGGRQRHQYIHAIDVLPTLLEMIGLDPPSTIGGIGQHEINGFSFAQSLQSSDAPESHLTQYYEMFGCRAIYHDGWKAVTYHPIQDTRLGFDDDVWELYHVAIDPSETVDLSNVNPDRLDQMIGLWWIEAGRHQVLPLDNRPFSEFTLDRPLPVAPRQRYVYVADRPLVPEIVAVNLRNRTHVVYADIEVPPDGAEGVVVAQGSGLGGWCLYFDQGKPHYVHNFVSLEEHHLATESVTSPGSHRLTFHYDKVRDHRGMGRILIDDVLLAEGLIPHFTPMRFSVTGAGLTVGYGDGLAVTRRINGPSPFNGLVNQVVIEVDGTPYGDPEGEAHIALARQ
jgi:arylsulfatase A-like enzyme